MKFTIPPVIAQANMYVNDAGTWVALQGTQAAGVEMDIVTQTKTPLVVLAL